ncbi:ADP-ribose pyrophosphatase, putative [Bodo saltans]|uniref:ADP-ribose pyrophosphatase, putative n=1 Tax=Bodo saltans TaxID=75058 RepID=A0A0S4INN8_BODSA|nr:ADP-ribose pyrophosphatase, putative [Bodo saltans]|eukprot:CUF69498.1 ADP-ribose pyrophosphatase, putative [Bodo saltans]
MALDPRPFFNLLVDAFTGRFLLLVSVVYFAVKGFAFRALMNVELPYFKNYLNISGDTYQTYYNVTMMSFAVKPLVGVISDNLPIFGYRKRFYVVLYCVIGGAATTIATQVEASPSSGSLAAALLFAAMLGIAATDLLCEGKYSEIMAQRPEVGSRLVSWIWGCYTVGGIIAAGVGGPLADLGDSTKILWITFPFFLLPIIPALLGWVPEAKVSRCCMMCDDEGSDELTGEERVLLEASARKQVVAPDVPTVVADEAHHSVEKSVTVLHKSRIVILSVATSIAAIGTILVSLYGDNLDTIIYNATVVTALFIASFFVIPPAAAKANLFMFLKEFLYLQINGSIDYFYTADEKCVPGGPNFGYTFYQTYAMLATNGACMLAVIFFQKFLSGTRFRMVFWLTTLLKITVSLVDIVMVNRWNRDIGISDEITYMLGDAFMYQATTMIDFMPAAVLMSRLCPAGLESTMFALLAGFSNFGQNLGRSVGVVLAEHLDIRTVVPCNFDKLYLLIGIGHMLMPALLLPLSILLISDEPMQTDDDSKHRRGGASEPEESEEARPLYQEGGSSATTSPTTGKGPDYSLRAPSALRTSRAATRCSSRRRSVRFSMYGGDEIEVFYEIEDDLIGEGAGGMRRRRSTAADALRASLGLRQM